MAHGRSFSEQRVRIIKKALIAGTQPLAIARLEGVCENTILRIKNGQTYAHVKVEGEEALRPTINTNGYVPERAHGTSNVVLPEVSEEELDASRERLERLLNAPSSGITPDEALESIMGQRPSPQE